MSLRVGVLELALCEEVVDKLDGRACDDDASAAHELFDIITLQLAEKCFGLVVMACFFNDGVVGGDVEDSGAVAADDRFDVALADDGGCGHFIEGHFLIDDVGVGVAEGSDHVDALFDLFDHLVHHFGVAVACDGDFVDAGCGACRGADALDVEASACEDDRELVEQSDVVFGENDYGV